MLSQNSVDTAVLSVVAFASAVTAPQVGTSAPYLQAGVRDDWPAPPMIPPEDKPWHTEQAVKKAVQRGATVKAAILTDPGLEPRWPIAHLLQGRTNKTSQSGNPSRLI